MARTPEQKLIDDWHKMFNQIPGMVYQRIENAMDNSTPDECYSIDGVNGWIEYKVEKVPDKEVIEEYRPKLKKWTIGQRKWMTDRAPNRTIFLVIRFYNKYGFSDVICRGAFLEFFPKQTIDLFVRKKGITLVGFPDISWDFVESDDNIFKHLLKGEY